MTTGFQTLVGTVTPSGGPGPFYFAWQDATDTTFSSAYKREDEAILSADVIHKENEFPILEIEIVNPRIGLLTPGRKQWAWFSYDTGTTAGVVPLFFGRLVGLPQNIFGQTIKLQFIARSAKWLVKQQALAETLKVLPNYDPIFIDPARRDDPSSVLEGYSAVWHYGRVPTGTTPDLQITTSDILQAEDGVEVFNEIDSFYDSINFRIGQQPLTIVYMKSQVHWTQQSAGTIGGFGENILSITPSGNYTISLSTGVKAYTGESLVGDWPKTGTQFAGGYEVAASWAFGAGAQYGQPVQHQYAWENSSQNHLDGDVMSQQSTWTTYPCAGDIYTYNLSLQPGLVDPYGSLTLGGPSGVNIPLHVSYSESLVCMWNVSAFLSLDYQAIRPRTEYLEFKLNSDLQPILTDPNEPASLDTETITLAGSDVSSPLQSPLNWYALTADGGWVAGSVPLGTIVESTQEFVGPRIYSICVASTGNVGTSEPAWSDVPGDSVSDGSVTWASLGTSLPADYGKWDSVAYSQVSLGTIIKAMNYITSPVDRAGIPLPAPASSIQSFQLCTQAGITQHYTTPLGTGIADVNPTHPEPAFSATPGVVTVDGSVHWTSLGDGGGSIEVPLGLDLGRRSYFPTNRGIQSIGYLIAVARARLLLRSRVVHVSFDCRFERAINLSCRKAALIYDPRFPGGQVLGKIIEYSFSAHGDRGELIGRVSIGASAGFGGHVAITPGTPVYIDDSYIDPSYQYHTGQVVSYSVNDQSVGFTPPIDDPDDDGLTFPLTNKNQIIVKEMMVSGTPPGAAQHLGGSTFLFQNVITRKLNPLGGVFSQTIFENINVPNGYTPVEVPTDMRVVPTYFGAPTMTTTNALWFYPVTQYYLELKPLQGMSFSSQYNVVTTKLNVPNLVNLEAPSSP